MAGKNQVVIIGIIYNSHSDAIRFVESINDCFGDDVRVILVDNSETLPASFFMEKIRGYNFITFIKSEKNLGYFRGAQAGLIHYLENNHIYPPWIIVCNVDIIFETRNITEKLASYDHVPDLGAIAPRISSHQWKTDLNPYLIERMPLRKLNLLRKIYSNVLLHNSYVLLHFIKKITGMICMVPRPGKERTDSTLIIYAPHGSCIIFNRKYFEMGGGLDHISFLFGEEIFVGETVKNIGLNVLYVPDIRLRHYEHSSIGNFISLRINKFYRQSIIDIINNYYKKNGAR
jgi:GT2 family glycosyltransferase